MAWQSWRPGCARRRCASRPSRRPGSTGTLRPYQHVGLGWLVRMRELGMGALLADDMGLGKTVQLIAYLLDRSDRDERPALIVAPTSVLGNWQRELQRFAPRSAAASTTARIGRPASPSCRSTTSCSRPTRCFPVTGRCCSGASGGRVVLDEAQDVKNPRREQARAARALPRRHRVALTGTPVENRLGSSGRSWSSSTRACSARGRPSARASRSPIERAAATRTPPSACARLTGPFILRRLKTDRAIIADLPEQVEIRSTAR